MLEVPSVASLFWQGVRCCEVIIMHVHAWSVLYDWKRECVEQGEDDKFLAEQLLAGNFEEACKAAGAPLILRMQPGYDHSFFFIATFIDDHIAHHAQFLKSG